MTIFDTIIDLSEDTNVPIVESLTVGCASVDISSAAGGAPEAPISCASTKYSGDSINLQASPNGAIGPYYVRFWRMPTSGGVMSYGEIGAVRTVAEGSSTSTSFTLYDTDLVAAIGKPTAGTPYTDALGNITDPLNSTNALAVGNIRVATTIYDSCPLGGQSCISYCDVVLGCVAPTCNFTVI